MTVNITSKQMDITPAIRKHVEDRLTKLDKWQAQLINPHIVLSKEPQGLLPMPLSVHQWVPWSPAPSMMICMLPLMN